MPLRIITLYRRISRAKFKPCCPEEVGEYRSIDYVVLTVQPSGTPVHLRTVDEIELLQELGIVEQDVLYQLWLPCRHVRLDGAALASLCVGCQIQNRERNYIVVPISTSCRAVFKASRNDDTRVGLGCSTKKNHRR